MNTYKLDTVRPVELDRVTKETILRALQVAYEATNARLDMNEYRRVISIVRNIEPRNN